MHIGEHLSASPAIKSCALRLSPHSRLLPVPPCLATQWLMHTWPLMRDKARPAQRPLMRDKARPAVEVMREKAPGQCSRAGGNRFLKWHHMVVPVLGTGLYVLVPGGAKNGPGNGTV